jgi:pyruvate/2-oxoglutarate dehydrogenase complex dihydrolipoamide acyltransferase (E2) component
MAIELKMPQLGVTMTEGEITAWYVQNGATVEEGELLYTVATDKTETDIESPAAGVLEVIGEVDTTYPVGSVVGRLV